MPLELAWKIVEDIMEIPIDIRCNPMYEQKDWWIHEARIRFDSHAVKLDFEDTYHTWEFRARRWVLVKDEPRKRS